MTSITIPNSVTSIGNYALWSDSDLLVKVFYAGSATEWSSISVGYCNDGSRLYYYSEEEPTESEYYWHYVDGVPTIWEI